MKYEKGSFTTVPFTDRLKGLSPIIQVIYLWMCKHANEDGQCFPSQKLLAYECGIDRKTINRYIPIMIEKGLLLQDKRYSGNQEITSMYHIGIGSTSQVQGSTSQVQGGSTSQVQGTKYTSLTKSKELRARVKETGKQEAKPNDGIPPSLDAIQNSEPRPKKTNTYPTCGAEVTEYAKSNGYAVDGERIFKYYNDADWYDSHGKKVRSWKQKVLSVWCKQENKIKTPEELYQERQKKHYDIVKYTTVADLGF
jgi:hypothetical protein